MFGIMTQKYDSPMVFSPVCGIFGLKCLGSRTNVTYPTFSPDLASVPANSCGGVFVENRTYSKKCKLSNRHGEYGRVTFLSGKACER